MTVYGLECLGDTDWLLVFFLGLAFIDTPLEDGSTKRSLAGYSPVPACLIQLV